MMKQSLGLFFLLTVIMSGHSQDYNNLVKKKQNLTQESEVLSDLLTETISNKTHTIEALNLIDAKIKIQEDVLDVINKAIAALKKDELSIEKKINQTSTELKLLKENYARLIRITNQSIRSYNRLLFFLSSSSFNQLLRRLHHFKQLEINRKNKHKEIKEKEKTLNSSRQLIIEKKAEQAELILQKNTELKLLKDNKLIQEKTIKALKNKESSLEQEIKSKKLEAEKIAKEILAVLEKENEKENNLTPELKLISVNFQSNKGRLPWPVPNGSILTRFGKAPHPVLNGIVIMNNGIEIVTKNNHVRSIFDGKVSKIIVLPTGLKVVIVNHGNYLTVYSNLNDVTVKRGQKIKTKENIGTLYNKKTGKNNTLGFQVWKGREKLNPTDWISGH